MCNGWSVEGLAEVSREEAGSGQEAALHRLCRDGAERVQSCQLDTERLLQVVEERLVEVSEVCGRWMFGSVLDGTVVAVVRADV